MADSDAGKQTAGLRRYARLALARLASARAEIDELNVYPVPDGDTGTNLYLTARATVEAFPADDTDRTDMLRALSRGALLGARGNSGVILSQLIGAFARAVDAAPRGLTGDSLAVALRAASDAAYAAVERPVEGTILSVAAAAADAAETAEGELPERLAAAATAAETALAATPDQLRVLADAGVVDAGGKGLCVLLAAAVEAVAGTMPDEGAEDDDGQVSTAPTLPTGDLDADGPAYEVMYLLETGPDEQVDDLRSRLRILGDSLVVVGGEGLWHVHVHVDDVGAAVEAGIDSGRVRRIRVTHFADQVAGRAAGQAAEQVAEQVAGQGVGTRSVVTVAAGDGLARLFADAGARTVVAVPGRRASAGEVLAAIRETGSREVIVLPNDPDTVGVAEIAAREAADAGCHVVVIPTQAQVQGLAAMAVHDAARSLEDDVVSMTAAARGTRHGAVTVAAKRAMTMAGACEPGDALGVVQGDFVVVGDDMSQVALDVLDRLLAGGGELVTVVAGQDGTDLARHCEEWVTRTHPGTEVLVYDGGQQRYPLLLSVE